MANRTTENLLAPHGIDLPLFEDYLATIGIDRTYERHVKRKSPTRFRFIRSSWDDDRWYSPPEQWALNNAQIARHLIGEETYGIRAGRFKSVFSFVDFDLDNAKSDLHDERLDTLVRFFMSKGDKVEGLLQRRPESGNFSLLFRCQPLYPEDLHYFATNICRSMGLTPKPGYLEIYPSISHGRRLPLGGTMEVSLICSNGLDDWEAFRIDDKADQLRELRDLPALNLRGIHSQIYKIKKPTRQLAIRMRPLPDVAEGPYAEAIRINRDGLTAPSTRYDAEKKLIYWHFMTSKSEQMAVELIKQWYRNGRTNGLSKDWKEKPQSVLKALKSHVTTFYKWIRSRKGNEHISALPIADADIRRVFVICCGLKKSVERLHCAEWLTELLQWVKGRRKYQAHLHLTARQMRKFKNGRDAHTKWLPYLKGRGIFLCVDSTYEVGHRCRIWRLRWDFAPDPEGAQDTPTSYRQAVVRVTTHGEIRGSFSRTTAWRLNRGRKIQGPQVSFVPNSESQGVETSIEAQKVETSIEAQQVETSIEAQQVESYTPKRGWTLEQLREWYTKARPRSQSP